MARKKIETIINEKIAPYKLNNIGKSNIAQLVRKYPYELLLECIDIGVAKYFRYDDEGVILEESVIEFLNKIGGIAFNKSRTPIDQEIYHLIKKGQGMFPSWNGHKADYLLHEYISELGKWWSDDDILEDLKGETSRMLNNSSSWSAWCVVMKKWIEDIKNWDKNSDVIVSQAGSILPNELFSDLQSNIQSICKQINSSYENNLFDCAAVMMRRLLESLLVLSYQKAGIEYEIIIGNYHVTLDKIIKNAEQNLTLALSSNTKKDMSLFKDLGNYSAHKIWYNCTKGDIQPHVLKYRAIIEELMYKSGIK